MEKKPSSSLKWDKIAKKPFTNIFVFHIGVAAKFGNFSNSDEKKYRGRKPGKRFLPPPRTLRYSGGDPPPQPTVF